MAMQTIQMARTGVRITAPLAAGVLCLWWLSARVEPGTLNNLPGALGALSSLTICAAVLCTMISFYAIGRYDALAHRHFQTGVAPFAAKTSGALAVALSQTLGFGLFTGAAVRWRMLPGLRFADALRLSGFVCFSFMMAIGFITAFACLFLGSPEWMFFPALLILAGLIVLIGAVSFTPACVPLRRRRMVPSLTALGAIGTWAALDLIAAASVLFMLIPADDLLFSTFLPIFLIAYGGALITGAPGGVGPFELALISLLPQVPTSDLLAGIVAYRMLYFALPAMIATAALLRPFAPIRPKTERTTIDERSAEARTLRQSGAQITSIADSTCLLWTTNQTLTVLPSPKSRLHLLGFSTVQDRATLQNRIPILYKCSAAIAVDARRQGWAVARIADEAMINPTTFSTAPRACRGLRRKLRQASQAGVKVRTPTRLPHPAMARIDAQWQQHKGGARGGTIGRYCPANLHEHRVFLAYVDAQLVGFMTFNTIGGHWCLDLVRCAPDAPDGTAHMLVVHALNMAAKERVTSFSLAAVPACGDHLKGVSRQLANALMKRGGAAGLRQFKGSFAPDWQPRYAASPNAVALTIGLLDIAIEIHFPAPLAHPGENHENIHNQDEDYEVALHKAA